MLASTPDLAETPPPSVPESEGKGARWRADTLAGVVGAIVAVPDGLASAAMTGVNPIYGLYASASSALGGTWLQSSQVMRIATTSAASLAAAKAISGYIGSPDLDGALFLFVLLVGAWQVLFGVLKLGKLTRYVSHSVMTGFLIGVAVLLVLSQLPDLVGYESSGGNAVRVALEMLRDISEYNWPTVVIGALSLVLLVVLGRTRVGRYSTLIALIVPALVVVFFNMSTVLQVQDVTPIPRGIPSMLIPNFALLTPDLFFSALAVAVVILVQGAGVGQSFPNPDGTRVNASRDFVAQGAANLASSLFQGIPVGGSVGQTALNVSLGARTRWAGILTGLFMIGIILIIPGMVGYAPLASLAALMIMAGIQAINMPEERSIWRMGWTSRAPMLATMLATLFLSIPLAVAIGVIISVILYLVQSSSEMMIDELVPLPDGNIEVRMPAEELASRKVTLLDIEGSLYFAGARRFEELLPKTGKSRIPVVVLRLRRRSSVESTLVGVLADYAGQLAAADGRLYVSGIDPAVLSQIERSGKLDLGNSVQIYMATTILGESTRRAYQDATAWLAEQPEDPETAP